MTVHALQFTLDNAGSILAEMLEEEPVHSLDDAARLLENRAEIISMFGEDREWPADAEAWLAAFDAELTEEADGLFGTAMDPHWWHLVGDTVECATCTNCRLIAALS